MIYGNITNCSVVGHGVISAWQCRLGYQIISENTSTNTRQIKLQLEARSVNSNYTAVGYQLTPTIDGLNLTPIGMNFSQANTNVWQVLGTRIITLVGAFDGEKYGSFNTNVTNEWGLKSGSASVYIALDNLHTPPQITGILIQEKNELLNNATDIVQFLSVKNYTFDTTTFDDATISSYQVYHNGILIGSSTENDLTIDYDSVGTLATFEMDNKIFAMLRFVVIDSYKTSSFIEVPYEVTAYVKPNLVKTSSSIKRTGQLSGKVKLSLIGTFFNQAINEIPNVINLQFKYWKKGVEEPSKYYNIPYEAIDNNINLFNWAMAINGKEIEDVDSNFAYNFKIKATDYFNKTSEIELLCPVGEYLWAEFKDRVDFKDITIKNQNPFLYSTKETRIGSLEDGTNVYRKLYEGIISSADKEILQSNIINMDVLDFSKGRVNNQSGTQLGLGYNREGYGSQLYLYNGELTLAHTSDIVGNYRIMLDYAKTRGYLIKGNSKQETTQGTNYFNATKIDSSSKIITTENGRTLTLPLLTSGAGVVAIGKLGNVCPNLKVGDTVYCFFTRKYDSVSDFIYLSTSALRWGNGTSKTITQEMLDSYVYLYGNNVNRGEDFQQVLYDFRIVKNSTDEWEKYTNGASPNPDYQQPIAVVDNVKIKVGEQETTIDLKGNSVSKRGDIQDYLLIHKNKYWLVKNVGKIVLNGSENWSLNSSYNAFMLYSSLSKGGNVTSNYYRGITQGLSTNDNVILFNPTTLYIKDTSIKNTTEFKNILKERYDSGNPVEIYFPLAQPYTEDLGELPEEIKVDEDVQLISNLDTTIEITDNFDFDTYKKY